MITSSPAARLLPAGSDPAPLESPGIAPLPRSLLEGAGDAACRVLQVRNLRHRSALLDVGSRPDLRAGAVKAVYDVIAENWRRSRSAQPSYGSQANWRWRKPQVKYTPGNQSREVIFEREFIRACEQAGREDWANQVPVSSGICGPAADHTRAIDLVHRVAPGHFELIELKIGSDNPLFAAFEVLGYACLWLLARTEPRKVKKLLLEADKLDAVVLAPARYYQRYRLASLASRINAELAALGEKHGVELAFRFEAFLDAYADAPLTGESVTAVIHGRRAL